MSIDVEIARTFQYDLCGTADLQFLTVQIDNLIVNPAPLGAADAYKGRPS
ncbi:MAG: hypothetical protein PVI72_12550 [Desulfobacterales bacterium]